VAYQEARIFARNVAFSLVPTSVPKFTQKFETEILPLLQKQAGFREEFVLLGDDNIHVHAISLWESREHAEADDKKAYPQVLETLAEIVVGTPRVRISNVVSSTVSMTTAGAA
jgi:heme-degrading monooxygenase HmoA